MSYAITLLQLQKLNSFIHRTNPTDEMIEILPTVIGFIADSRFSFKLSENGSHHSRRALHLIACSVYADSHAATLT